MAVTAGGAGAVGSVAGAAKSVLGGGGGDGSCRHYYATQSLLHGVSPYDLSKNMDNSERMIRMHYDHVLIDLRSGSLTGSDQVIGSWLLQRGNLEQELDRIANDPDDHLTEEDGYRR
jgi:hypothetical protein